MGNAIDPCWLAGHMSWFVLHGNCPAFVVGGGYEETDEKRRMAMSNPMDLASIIRPLIMAVHEGLAAGF